MGYGKEWFNPKKGVVVCYENGQHFRSRTFDVTVNKNLQYNVKVSALFLPLQLHEEEAEFQKKARDKLGLRKEYIIPYGGDVFSLFINGQAVNLFVMDIMGHGFICHKIAEYFVKFSVRHRSSPNLAEAVGRSWTKNRKKRQKEAIAELNAIGKEIRKYGYSPAIIKNHTKALKTSAFLKSFLTACQCNVNLKDRKITFTNFGNPDQYFIVLTPKGKGWKPKLFAASKRNPAFGIINFTEEQIIKEQLVRSKKEMDRFRVVMFSDAILEQGINLDLRKKNVKELMAQLRNQKLRKNHEALIKKKIGYKTIQDLFVETISHMATREAKEFLDFFYSYLVGLNRHVQGDDITLAVVDFERKTL